MARPEQRNQAQFLFAMFSWPLWQKGFGLLTGEIAVRCVQLRAALLVLFFVPGSDCMLPWTSAARWLLLRRAGVTPLPMSQSTREKSRHRATSKVTQANPKQPETSNQHNELPVMLPIGCGKPRAQTIETDRSRLTATSDRPRAGRLGSPPCPGRVCGHRKLRTDPEAESPESEGPPLFPLFFPEARLLWRGTPQNGFKFSRIPCLFGTSVPLSVFFCGCKGKPISFFWGSPQETSIFFHLSSAGSALVSHLGMAGVDPGRPVKSPRPRHLLL